MAGVRKREGYWQIWWIVKSGRVWGRLPLKDFTKPKALKEAIRREVQAESPPEKSLGFYKFAIDYIQMKHFKDSTRKRCEFTALNFEKFLKGHRAGVVLKDITEAIIYEYINERSQKYKPPGINLDLRNLRPIFDYAVKQKIMEESPMIKVRYLKENKKVVQIPTDEEVRDILKWFQANAFCISLGYILWPLMDGAGMNFGIYGLVMLI